jgi:multiple antibiotic resistance protein
MRKRVALLAVLVGIFMLILFLYLGPCLLEQMHIGTPAFRTAGTAILFNLALHMSFGGHYAGDTADAHRSPAEIAVFPVAMPGIASGGALYAVLLLTDNTRSPSSRRPSRRGSPSVSCRSPWSRFGDNLHPATSRQCRDQASSSRSWG